MRIVVKVGTSTLAYPTGHMNIRRIEQLCKALSDIKNSGHEVVLVSSGAIGMGRAKLSLKERPKDMPTKQAAAAVGQCELMYVYDRYFGEYNHTVGQILLTKSDFSQEDRYRNFKNTLHRLLELEALPVINENDSVATEEIAVGDNDTLAALVARSVEADLLVLLTDIDGLYTANPKKDPNAVRIPEVSEITDALMEIAGGTDSGLGTGGMHTKLEAARLCLEQDINMIIAAGQDPLVLYRIMDGEDVGTFFGTRR